MIKRKLGVELYSLRNEAAKCGMAYVLKAVKDMGYMCVEPAGFADMTAEDFAKALKDFGLEAYSLHSLSCAPDAIDKTIETLKLFDCKYLVTGFGRDAFKDLDSIKAAADQTNAVIEKAEAAGLTVVQHNHAHEFEYLDGQLKYDIYAELCPKIKFQLDIYWSTNFFANDAVDMINKYYDRIELLHLKDGIGTGNIHMRPLGEGKLNIPAIMAACPDFIDHVIVELDNTPFNQIVALQRSYEYMTQNGLGIGYK